MRTIGQEVTYEDFHKNYKFFCQKISRTTDFTEALKIIRELIARADKQIYLLSAVMRGKEAVKFSIDDFNMIRRFFLGKKQNQKTLTEHITILKKRKRALTAFLKKYEEKDDRQT